MVCIILLTILTFATACAHHATIVPFKPLATDSKQDPTAVEIYRTRGPYTKIQELGMISFHTEAPRMVRIYDQLRIDAAKAGANAVIDLKVKSETHEETKTVEKCEEHDECDAEGKCESKKVCHNEEEKEDVTTFMAVGTMITGRKL